MRPFCPDLVLPRLVIIFWNVFMPGLIKYKMAHLSDPSTVKNFPYRHDILDSPTKHLVDMSPDLQSDVIASFLRGGGDGALPHDRTVDQVLDLVKRDAASAPKWRRSPLVTLAITVFGAFVVLPEGVQDMTVEWFFEMMPLPSLIVFSKIAKAMGDAYQIGDDHSGAIVLVAVVWAFVTAVFGVVVLVRCAGPSLPKCRAGRRRARRRAPWTRGPAQ